ncbi:hypothetical protein [Stenotrophomonas sp.]|uniref:hypothetical protein n=1 Tax=Stenotrophomonas sp. TaxID=69392 RepID=UPI0028B15C35|nr:hypothetical protein [Stenotrophomonas sp.]
MPFNIFSRSPHQLPAQRPFRLPFVRLATPPARQNRQPDAGRIPHSLAPPLPLRSVTNTSAEPSGSPVVPPPVPPRRHPPAFVAIVKKFPKYVGEWDSESEDEPLTLWEIEDCDARFEGETNQVTDHESRFAAVTPAFGHKVLPQHQQLLDRLPDAPGMVVPPTPPGTQAHVLSQMKEI